jgi:hypothetical protein
MELNDQMLVNALVCESYLGHEVDYLHLLRMEMPFHMIRVMPVSSESILSRH